MLVRNVPTTVIIVVVVIIVVIIIIVVVIIIIAVVIIIIIIILSYVGTQSASEANTGTLKPKDKSLRIKDISTYNGSHSTFAALFSY